MKKYFGKIAAIILICVVSLNLNAQTAAEKNRKFTFYLGAGPNFYFNNLVLAKDYVNELNYSVVARIMWEPEHYLSLGIESGYNQFYSMDIDAGNGNVSIINAAIPIQIVVSMKFFENFYGNFTLGQSILKNMVSTDSQGDFNASTVSLGDFSAAIGYRKLINPRIYLGTEAKGYYSSKLQDRNVALVFLGGYRF